jgi:hypothetical protein
LSNKHLKDKYNETFKVVKKIVNEWNPVGLLPSAPEDEYELEIARIVALVLCQENGHVKQREIAELRQLLFSD